MMCLGVVSLSLFCLAFVQLLESVRLYLLLNFGSFQVSVQIHFHHHPFLLFFQDSNDTNVKYVKSPMFLRLWVLFVCFQSVILLLFRLDNFCSGFFKFSNSFLCAPHSAVEPIHQLIKNCIF